MELFSLAHTHIVGSPILAIILIVVLAFLAFKIVGALVRVAVKVAVLGCIVVGILLLAPTLLGAHNGKALQSELSAQAHNARLCATLLHNKKPTASDRAILRRCANSAENIAKSNRSKAGKHLKHANKHVSRHARKHTKK